MLRLSPILLLAAACSTAGPDHWVDVQGAVVHARVVGPRFAPVVILESGAGQDMRVWDGVAEELSEFARVVTWSRPGLGGSGMGLVGRGSPRIVEELRIVLKDIGVEPPYVLVGHALGAFHVRAFAALHREEVAAMVLIDPSHEDWLKRLKLTRTSMEWRDIGHEFHREVNLLPEGSRREFAALEEDASRMTRLPVLPACPVWILTCSRYGPLERDAGQREGDIALWEELHAELAHSMHADALVEHVICPDLGSDVLIERPDSAVAGVVWALNELSRR